MTVLSRFFPACSFRYLCAIFLKTKRSFFVILTAAISRSLPFLSCDHSQRPRRRLYTGPELTRKYPYHLIVKSLNQRRPFVARLIPRQHGAHREHGTDMLGGG